MKIVRCKPIGQCKAVVFSAGLTTSKPQVWTMRIILPGMDIDNSALWFETTIERDTFEQALQTLEDAVACLPNVVIRRDNND